MTFEQQVMASLSCTAPDSATEAASGILKNIHLHGERPHLQFPAEMFNLMSRVQFSMPAYVSVVDTGVAGWRLQPRFGEITSQNNTPRYMQMPLRYFF